MVKEQILLDYKIVRFDSILNPVLMYCSNNGKTDRKNVVQVRYNIFIWLKSDKILSNKNQD